MAPGIDKVAFAAFTEAGWDIFINESFEEYVEEHDFPQERPDNLVAMPMPAPDVVVDVTPVEHERGLFKLPLDLARTELTQSRSQEEGRDPTLRDDESRPSDSDPIADPSEPLATAEADSLELARLRGEAVDGGEAEKPRFTPRRPIGTVEEYSLRFSLDPVGGGLGGLYYTEGVGLGVANQISLSDLFGNHRMSFLVNFYGSIEYSDLAASYSYRKRRVNFAGGVFHYRNYINSTFTSLGEVLDRSQLFSERNYGVFGLASLPFTQFDRLDFELQGFVSEKTFYDTNDDFFYFESSKEHDRLLQPSLTLVHDSAFFGPHGPMTGSRWTLSFAQALPLIDEDLDRTTAFADFRRYFRIFGRQSFAVRTVAAQSTGGTRRQFIMGGPGTVRGYDIFDFERTDGNGNPRYDNLLGSKLVMFNAEYRFPLIDALYLGWPGRFGIGGIGGAAFFDTGAAFDRDLVFFGKSDEGDFRLEGLKGSFGFGIRANVFALPLKFDWAWKTDLDRVEPHVQYNFSIAPEF